MRCDAMRCSRTRVRGYMAMDIALLAVLKLSTWMHSRGSAALVVAKQKFQFRPLYSQKMRYNNNGRYPQLVNFHSRTRFFVAFNDVIGNSVGATVAYVGTRQVRVHTYCKQRRYRYIYLDSQDGAFASPRRYQVNVGLQVVLAQVNRQSLLLGQLGTSHL